MATVRVDIGCSRARGEVICVHFVPSKFVTDRLKLIPGARKVRGHWHVPRDLTTARELREWFGDDLEIGDDLREWAWAEVRRQEEMSALAAAETGTLVRLPTVLPALADALHIGPRGKSMTEAERAVALTEPESFQVADVRYIVESDGPLNNNHAGTGKTLEWIGAVWEQALEEGDHLVICPKAAIDGTWEKELTHWQADRDDVEVFACVDNRANVEKVVEAWRTSTARVRWLVVNPAKVRWQKQDRWTSEQLEAMDYDQLYDLAHEYEADWDEDDDLVTVILHAQADLLSPLVRRVKGAKKEERACYCGATRGPHEHYVVPYPEIFERQWQTVCIDEAHRESVRNHKSLSAFSLGKLKRGKTILMTGTPMKKMGGSDLWGLLHFQNPRRFSSFWRFAEQFFDIEEGHFGKKVGLLRNDREQALYDELAPYVLRRTKGEVAPWLPDKLYVEVPCSMTKRQRTQYTMMDEESWARLGKHEVDALGALPRRTRLKQFANGHSKINDNGDIVPISSPKVDAMIEKVLEVGGKHLVFSRSRRMVEFAAEALYNAGVVTATLTGGTSSEDRRWAMDQMQNGDLEALVIVTTAGGTSLTLDAADSVHLIDESESPDDDEQAEDRAHRVSRVHQVTVFIYRMIGSIDYDINELKTGKSKTHAKILDERRRITSG